MDAFDVGVVGAGVIGLAVARELSARGHRVVVLEKNRRPGLEQTTHNSGVVHAGFTPRPGTLRARLAVAGNSLLYREARRWGVPIEASGTLVVAQTAGEMARLESLYRQGRENGVPGLRLIEPSEARTIEPHLGACAAAILAPSGGRVSAVRLVEALQAELLRRGARIDLGTPLSEVRPRPSGGWSLVSPNGTEYSVRYAVNSCGVASGRVAGWFGAQGLRVYPCAGEYAVVRNEKAKWVRSMIYGLPRPGYPGIGVHLTRSLDGPLLLGPTARYQDDETASASPTTPLEEFAAEVAPILPGLDASDLVRGATGVRAKLAPPGSSEAFEDYVIREEPAGSGAIQLVGIESPGLTASLAVGEYVARLIDASERRGA
ncbi:MAG TPA: NAD(P)/FAD-dependent oxidoreductase [Thermoplasmata archaeon]|nr:NAD(P)/FAD-dependent oxidoreductase [Thermoplasmata archaeon]HEV2428961.1 NAD(P)/FAD-dependent oxidoreductase [Thermoplasmata archaeon]